MTLTQVSLKVRLSNTNAGVGAGVGVDDTSDLTCVRYCNPFVVCEHLNTFRVLVFTYYFMPKSEPKRMSVVIHTGVASCLWLNTYLPAFYPHSQTRGCWQMPCAMGVRPPFESANKCSLPWPEIDVPGHLKTKM